MPQAGAPGAPGQSMRDGGMQGAPGAPGQSMRDAGAQGGPGAPAQSLRDPGMHAGPGEQAVSWMKPEQGAPGAPGQSMRDQGLPAGPGGAAISQISNEIVAPGQGSRSMLDGTQQSGVAGQSMREGAQGGGAPGQSMREGAQGGGAPGQSMLEAPAAGGAVGASGAPGTAGGAPGQSMTEGGSSGAPGAAPAGAAGTTGGPGQVSKDASADGSSGGPGAGPGGKKAEAELVAGETRGPKAAGELKSDAAKKDEAGASGGPGGKKAGAAAAAPGADDEEDLVDPDADRPNFGSAADEDEEAGEDDAKDDDGFAQVASRAGGAKAAKPVKISKPLNPAYTTAAMMAGIVASIVAVLWFGRAEISKMMPRFQSLYDKVGVEAPRPGDGLSIAESSKRLQRINGIETLVVQGYVANIGDIPRTVPGIRLDLYNEKKEVIQSETAPAPAGLLDPGASAAFDIRLELPQLTLAKGGYAVVWDVE